MAIKVMVKVWEESRQEGTPLLAMLALADWANEYGVSWPSMDTLATRCRLKMRRMQAIIKELEESGELYVKRGDGRRRSRFLITLGLDEKDIITTLTQDFGMKLEAAKSVAKRIENQRLRCSLLHPYGAVYCTPTVQSTAPLRCSLGSNDKPKTRKASSKTTSQPSLDPSLDPSIDSFAAANAPASEKSEPENQSILKEKDPKPVQMHIALIDAWHNAMPEDLRPIAPNYSRNVKVAKDLLQAGITAEQIAAFVKANYASYRDWAKQRKIPAIMALEHVRTYIRDWLKRQADSKPVDPTVTPVFNWRFDDDNK